MKKSFALLALMFVAYTCEQYPTDSIISEETGQLSIKMGITSIPAEVTQVSGMLIKPTMDTIFFDFEIGDNQAVASLEGIPVGTWTLRVDARNSEGVIVYSGTTEVQIIGGEVTSVQLHLSKTGSLDITVTWGSDIDLVAYYPFNGNANDESGNENHGEISGAILTEDRFGEANNAYRFDGVDDYIIVKYSSDFDFSMTREISFGAWIYINSLKYPDNVPLGMDAPCSYFAFALDVYKNGQLEGAIHSSYCWTLAVSMEQLALNKWYFLFCTINDNKLKLYINGEIAIEKEAPGIPWDNNYTGNLYIGAWGGLNPLDQFFNGKIDEVRIYDRVLDETEIEVLFTEDE